MNDALQHMRSILERRGIDPDAPVPADEPFDPAALRAEMYADRLARKIPTGFTAAKVDNLQVARWVERHKADPLADPALLLSGNTGTGKTWQAYGVLRDLVMSAAWANRTYRWQFVTHPELNSLMRPKPDGSHTWALEPFMDTDLLVLDDVGAGKQSEWTGDSLIRLVDHRWANCLATVYTTNLDPVGLEATVGDRVLSRMASACQVQLAGVDRRWGAA